MCGIVGTIGGDPGLAAARGPDALKVIAHRGPDDEGVWSDGRAWLGHRRLAIIDLSPGGHGPMVHQASGVVITFNGEIYNYIELRAELQAAGHRFHTESDTEVLLAGYLEWGSECLGRFNGMWSFLIWDPRDQTAFFARDRLGVKPFYFTHRDGALSFASEPKAILALHPELRRVDEAALYGFLAEGQLYTGDRSFYEGIKVLPAGHYGTFAPGSSEPKIHKFWAPPSDTVDGADYGESLQRFSDLLQDSVKLRMRSDVPVGFTLSGGLDSSAVLQAAVSVDSKGKGKLRAYTSVYDTPPGSPVIDERRWASLMAGKYERVELDQVVARDEDWLDILDRVIWHMDGPGYSPAVFPLWRIMERARATGVPVLLEGQGADELLGGYPQYAALALWDLLRRRQLSPFRRGFRAYSQTFTGRMLSLWLIRERLPFLVRANRRRVGSLGVLEPEFARRHGSASSTRPAGTVNGRLRADLTRDILPGLLHYGDAISMAHSIESRLPFLDYRLVEFASSLPGEFKVGQGESKRILRDHLRTVHLQEIAARTDKKGYPTPADDWLRAHDGAVLRSALLAPDAPIRAYCRPERMERLIRHHAAGRAGAGNHLYRLLATEMWLKKCISVGPEGQPWAK
jgi:asparagine synthase (glutamine-hydrolysing)